jgi:hypothetical protein
MSKKIDVRMNQAVEIAIGGTLLFLKEKIEIELEETTIMTYKNQVVIALIISISAIANEYTWLAKFSIPKRDLEEWKQKFVEWVDSKYSKIPKANVEEFKNDSIKEFDRLYKLISNSEQV